MNAALEAKRTSTSSTFSFAAKRLGEMLSGPESQIVVGAVGFGKALYLHGDIQVVPSSVKHGQRVGNT